MKRTHVGEYEQIATAGESVRAFVPAPLPPAPPVEMSPELLRLHEQALLAVQELNVQTALLPYKSLLLYSYVRKEAVLSSRIEGTQSSLSDLMTAEADGVPSVPMADVAEVSHYVAAAEHGLARLNDGMPLSLRLLREMHSILLRQGRGVHQNPGEFRRSQNWIGGTRPGNAVHVPPPAHRVEECMGKLELFIHDERVALPALVKTALVHVQFETIHPFLDGNGRVGRLLIILMLCNERILKEPLLYLSLYFKTHRQEYYRLLNDIRTSGDWEAWLTYFLEAVHSTARQAIETSRLLMERRRADEEQIKTLGRASRSAQRVFDCFASKLIYDYKQLVQESGLSPTTINISLARLAQLGIIEETSGKKRDRLYAYTPCINILNQEFEQA